MRKNTINSKSMEITEEILLEKLEKFYYDNFEYEMNEAAAC